MVVVFVRVVAFLVLEEQLVAVEQLPNCCYWIRLLALAWLLSQVLVLHVVRLVVHEGVDLQLDRRLLIFLPL